MKEATVPAGLVMLIFAVIVYALYRLLRLFKGHSEDDDKRMPSVHGFGIDAQTRRRRLDLTREDNTFKTSVIDRIQRQKRGIYGTGGKRKKRKRRKR